MMDTLRQDLRFARRQLVRSPGFAALAVAMLALGIGATTTIFSVIDAVFLRPPVHVREPERLVAVYTSDFSGPRFGTSSYPDFVDFAAGAAGLEGLAAATPRPFSVASGKQSFRAMGEMVSEDYFGLLGVPLAQGRGFISGESEVSPTDPATLVSVVVLFTTVALLASWLPARRAAAVDPIRALRSE
jgi:hypothetical protein